MFAAQEPRAAGPIGSLAPAAPNGEDITGDSVQALVENPGQTRAFLLVFEPGFERIDVGGQSAFAPEVVPGVFVSWQDVFGFDVENVGELMDEPGGFPFGVAVVHRFIRVERIIVPDDLPVLAPIAGEGPARQGLARIPFALAEVQQASRSKPVFQSANQHP